MNVLSRLMFTIVFGWGVYLLSYEISKGGQSEPLVIPLLVFVVILSGIISCIDLS